MTSIDPAFTNIKSTAEAFMKLWRIENLLPIPVPAEGHGKFFSGDSYILLVAEKARKNSSSLNYNIHFWLGEATTHDEMGAAAYKTVELDNALGGMATQHRETQGHESAKFLSYFKSMGGVMYMEGGAESGFKHVEGKEYTTRLLQLKGKRNVRVKQVALEAGALNEGDVFVLDMGLDIYQWNGATANKMEKAKALSVCTRLRDDRGANPKVHVLESSEKDDERTTPFWEALGGYSAPKSDADGGDDKAEERAAKKELKLYKCSNASGEMKTEIVGEGKLMRNMLDSAETFVLDTGSALYCWIGKNAEKDEKKEAFNVANSHLIENKRPAWTPVSMVLDSGETPAFKAFFFQWEPPMKPRDWSTPKSSGIAKTAEQKEIDVDSLLTERRKSLDMVDDGSGKINVWRIENFDKVSVDADQIGNFFSGDSYIVLYTYTPEGKAREEYIIYFWQGRNSSVDEKGTVALLATKMDDDMGGRPVQVRVVQGKEPSHFCALFKGKLVIHDGGKASAFKNSGAKDESDDDGISLFHIRGTTQVNTRAVQVAEVCGSLNSGDCFVLLTPGTVYSWNGKGSNDAEKATAKTSADSLVQWNNDGNEARSVVVIAEGEEDETFWSSIGGKGEYASEGLTQDAAIDGRLFEISNVTGTVRVEEVCNFSQDDLLDDDVMMLDTFSTVFIWIGSQANDAEKKAASDLAKKYIIGASAVDGRSPDTAIITIKAGSEPAMFTCHFLGWDSAAAGVFEDPYEKRMKSLSSTMSFVKAPSWAKKNVEVDIPETVVEESVGETKAPEAAAPAPAVPAKPAAVAAPAAAAATGGEYTYAQLKGNPCEVQSSIDPKGKEKYLSETEFQEVFKMDKTAFAALPGWKSKKAKVAAGLF
jgi:advillin